MIKTYCGSLCDTESTRLKSTEFNWMIIAVFKIRNYGLYTKHIFLEKLIFC